LLEGKILGVGDSSKPSFGKAGTCGEEGGAGGEILRKGREAGGGRIRQIHGSYHNCLGFWREKEVDRREGGGKQKRKRRQLGKGILAAGGQKLRAKLNAARTYFSNKEKKFLGLGNLKSKEGKNIEGQDVLGKVQHLVERLCLVDGRKGH